MSLRDRLVNWAFAMQGYTGPEIPNTCASAERNYLPEAGNTWDDDDDERFQPDMLDAEIVEKEVMALRAELKSAIKARYISYPYETDYYVAHRLRISPKKYKERLDDAHAKLAKQLREP
jgi:DNA-directed RNA polymerase specialized sigma24 family protein